MRKLDWNRLDESERTEALQRPRHRVDQLLLDRVSDIVDAVREYGWDRLRDIALKIDGAEPELVRVAPIAREARRISDPDRVAAIEFAARNIRTFHEASVPADLVVETIPGLVVRKLWRPIDRVGLYIPGGATPLFSTLLMLAIPASLAGVRDLIAVTPPRADGSVDPLIALAADLCGIEAIWTVGGAQAIAALAFGAGPIGRVDKICGPGNAWVAEAKRRVSSLPGGPAIDMPAGPSELMIIADEAADPRTLAMDLLGQAEHDAAAQVLLLSPSEPLLDRVSRAVEEQLADLPRAAIARASLVSARLVQVSDLAQAVDIANRYAPEHLSLAVAQAEELTPLVRNAGAIFEGPLAAETFGDYLAGSSHVLPTDGAARAWGGVSTSTFLKAMTVQSLTPAAASRLAAPAALLARMEGLEAHARAADARLECAQ